MSRIVFTAIRWSSSTGRNEFVADLWSEPFQASRSRALVLPVAFSLFLKLTHFFAFLVATKLLPINETLCVCVSTWTTLTITCSCSSPHSPLSCLDLQRYRRCLIVIVKIFAFSLNQMTHTLFLILHMTNKDRPIRLRNQVVLLSPSFSS